MSIVCNMKKPQVIILMWTFLVEKWSFVWNSLTLSMTMSFEVHAWRSKLKWFDVTDFLLNIEMATCVLWVKWLEIGDKMELEWKLKKVAMACMNLFIVEFQVALHMDWYRDSKCFISCCIGCWKWHALGSLWLHWMCFLESRSIQCVGRSMIWVTFIFISFNTYSSLNHFM